VEEEEEEEEEDLFVFNDTIEGPRAPVARVATFGARGRSSVRYGTRLGDLQNKQPTHTDIWENWTAGASHAGGSFSLGL